MKRLFILVVFLTTAANAHWFNDRSWDDAKSRRAFLLGMGWVQDVLVGRSGSEGFSPKEQQAQKVFEAVAKLHAADIGVAPEKLATDAWKAEVAKALAQKDDPPPAPQEMADPAYVAGAYVRWGTPTGFRMNGPHAYEIARRISSWNFLTLQMVHTSGYPGGYTITITDGGESPASDFFRLMHQFKAGVAKEPNKATGPATPSGRGSP